MKNPQNIPEEAVFQLGSGEYHFYATGVAFP